MTTTLFHADVRKTLERFMAWKFPFISPQVFRDMDLMLKELKWFGLDIIKELNELVSPEFVNELQKMELRSLDGIIRHPYHLRREEKEMETKTKYFGYDEDRISEIFRNSKAQVDINTKIDGALTLSQLVESSSRLLKENADFLREIYHNLDE